MPVVISGMMSEAEGKTPVPSGRVVSAGLVAGLVVGFVACGAVVAGTVVVPVVSGLFLHPVNKVAVRTNASAITLNFFIRKPPFCKFSVIISK